MPPFLPPYNWNWLFKHQFLPFECQICVCIYFNRVCWGQSFLPGELQVSNSFRVTRTGWLFFIFRLSSWNKEWSSLIAFHILSIFFIRRLNCMSSSSLNIHRAQTPAKIKKTTTHDKRFFF
jgi:hypothetical protein